MKASINLTLLTTLALCSGSAWAEKVYTWTDEDGKRHYSDTAPGDGRESQTIELKSNPPTTVFNPRREELQMKSDEAQRNIDARISARRQAEADLKEARTRLNAAKQALSEGRTPQPGEQLGKVGGGTRLTQAYRDRVLGLEKAVGAAEAEVKQLQIKLRDMR